MKFKNSENKLIKTTENTGKNPLLKIRRGAGVRYEKYAFTLAEVLITLGVIGVVSALTLPSVINNFQVSSWESGLKKSYATITNGFHAIASENGGDLRNSGLFDDVDDETFSDRIDEAVRKHFKVVKSCKIGDEENCIGYDSKFLNGQNSGKLFYAEKDYISYLEDGLIMMIRNNKCETVNFPNDSKLKHKCARIIIDTNGKKGPNTRGKDIFWLEHLDEKGNIYPSTSREWVNAEYGKNSNMFYWKTDAMHCGTENTKLKDETRNIIHGHNCLARIMENGWKMDYLR